MFRVLLMGCRATMTAKSIEDFQLKKHFGYTLIEIMLALLLGIIIVGATGSIYISSVKGSADTIKSARLNYDLETAMQFMINEIRRSGYWGGAVTGSDAMLNPAMLGGANITISDATGAAGNNCILYSYDADENGFNTPSDQTDDIGTDEFYGFKLENNTIKIRYAVAGTAAANLTCNVGSWENILDSDNVEITSLTFNDANSQCLNDSTDTSYSGTCATAVAAGDVGSGDTAVEIRQIDITLLGRVNGDTDVTKTLTGSVKVRNNFIFIQP